MVLVFTVKHASNEVPVMGDFTSLYAKFVVFTKFTRYYYIIMGNENHFTAVSVIHYIISLFTITKFCCISLVEDFYLLQERMIVTLHQMKS